MDKHLQRARHGAGQLRQHLAPVAKIDLRPSASFRNHDLLLLAVSRRGVIQQHGPCQDQWEALEQGREGGKPPVGQRWESCCAPGQFAARTRRGTAAHGATVAVTGGHVGPALAVLARGLATTCSHIIPDLKSKI